MTSLSGSVPRYWPALARQHVVGGLAGRQAVGRQTRRAVGAGAGGRVVLVRAARHRAQPAAPAHAARARRPQLFRRYNNTYHKIHTSLLNWKVFGGKSLPIWDVSSLRVRAMQTPMFGVCPNRTHIALYEGTAEAAGITTNRSQYPRPRWLRKPSLNILITLTLNKHLITIIYKPNHNQTS